MLSNHNRRKEQLAHLSVLLWIIVATECNYVFVEACCISLHAHGEIGRRRTIHTAIHSISDYLSISLLFMRSSPLHDKSMSPLRSTIAMMLNLNRAAFHQRCG